MSVETGVGIALHLNLKKKMFSCFKCNLHRWHLPGAFKGLLHISSSALIGEGMDVCQNYCAASIPEDETK